ncbi:MAG: ATP-binding protein [Nocardioides sp.]
MRRYCHDLRPSLLDDLGLLDAVDWLAGDLRARIGLLVEMGSEGAALRLGSRSELLIFRIVQEALHNVERHAEASWVRITLAYGADTVRVSVTDNGRGMAPVGGRSARDRPDPGLGLRGMDERAKLLGGRLRIHSRPGTGTEVTLTVPLGPTEPTELTPGFPAATA